MEDIAIYGAGGLGREIACLIKKINKEEARWNFIGFFDDGKEPHSWNEYGEVMGGIDVLNAWNRRLNVVIAIGTPGVIRKVADRILNENVSFPNLLWGLSLSDEDSLSMGKGNIVTGNTVFSCNVKVGDFNLFNGRVVLGHDVSVGSYNVFMPAVRVSGEVEIGDENLFGVGSIILQQLRIGTGVRLGAGSVLMRKPKDGSLYIGNPAKLFKY